MWLGSNDPCTQSFSTERDTENHHQVTHKNSQLHILVEKLLCASTSVIIF